MTNPSQRPDRCGAIIELLVLDVDGVLTDGRIVYTEHGDELKAFHVRDGWGIRTWLQLGKQAAIISGRKSRAVQARAAELGVEWIYEGISDKLAIYGELLSRLNLSREQVACVGDDLPDLPLLLSCGLAVAVADACNEVRAVANHITTAVGGAGAVREAIEFVLKREGRWSEVIDLYEQRTPCSATGGRRAAI